jgi:hypothetical protein
VYAPQSAWNAGAPLKWSPTSALASLDEKERCFLLLSERGERCSLIGDDAKSDNRGDVGFQTLF